MTPPDRLPDYDDEKAPDALRTIGEVSKALGIRQHVLRYWEEQFPQLKPIKRSGGRRYYRPDDVLLIAKIDRLVHREGYTLRGARRAIAAKANAPAPAGAQVAENSSPVDALVAVRDRLAKALSES